MNGEHKITGFTGAAGCHLRQSSMAQVRDHTESTREPVVWRRRQPGWGWRTSIEIDTDLGISGKWGVAREGFTELVTRMCRGDVGAIFRIGSPGWPVPRDVARLAGRPDHRALLIDPDGVTIPPT